jgi:transposase
LLFCVGRDGKERYEKGQKEEEQKKVVGKNRRYGRIKERKNRVRNVDTKEIVPHFISTGFLN